jgi:lipid-A-disaccharide synthase
MKIFLCAGEASGDIHGANLVRALRALEPTIECEGLGGLRMQQAGMILRHDLAGRGIMGFVEVVKSFGYIKGVFDDTLARLRENPPDALVLVDYPGFNLRLAGRAHAMGIAVVYYISPQIWAWKKGRIKHIRRYVKKMLTILPFEKAIYDQAGVPCEYVGHPLLDHIAQTPVSPAYEGGTVIGVLPGSRKMEIERVLPVMLEVARRLREQSPGARFVAPCVDEARQEQVRALAGDFPLETAVGGMYDVLRAARFCMVCSGTATLETALFNVPMVVLYRATPVSVWIARRLVGKRLVGISLVNILAHRVIVPEFIQEQATPERILPHALELISDSTARREMLAGLEAIRGLLKPGASEAAAREVLVVARGAAHGR